MATGGLQGYAIQADVTARERVERWRPLILWLVVIPQRVVIFIYGTGLMFAMIVGWFAALFTAHLPDWLERYATGYLRYQWRVVAYLYAWSTRYPGFSLPSGDADPGGDPAVLSFHRDQRLSRVRVLFRFFMALPHFVVLYFVSIVVGVAALAAWFVVLFTGRWPEGLRSFVVGANRWSLRVSGFYYMVTDAYPPFSLT